MEQTEIPGTESPVTEGLPRSKRNNPGWVAVAEYYIGPSADPATKTIVAETKREMMDKLSDPAITSVLAVIRGRMVNFQERRKISF